MASTTRRKTGIIVSGAALIALVAVWAGFAFAGRPTPEAQPKKIAVDTAEVTRENLADRVRVVGRIGYASRGSIGTSLPGVVTAVPTPGAVVTRGGELFRVDDRPVLLMIGELPVWRAFASDMEDGPDVLQLERNLAELGFFDRDADEEFTWATAEVIRDWQESLGQERTGEIELGRVVFAQGDVRIAAITAKVGSPAGDAIIAVSDPVKAVTIDIDPNIATAAPLGTELRFSLPDGTQTSGIVTAVGAPTQRETEDGKKSMKVPLTLTPNDEAATSGVTEAKITATLVRSIADDVITVPVLALLARADGSFVVERVSGDKREDVAVILGAFGDGRVEIRESTLAVGDRVVVGG